MGVCFSSPQDQAHPEGRGLFSFTSASPGCLSPRDWRGLRGGMWQAGFVCPALSLQATSSHTLIFRELLPLLQAGGATWTAVKGPPCQVPVSGSEVAIRLRAGRVSVLPRGFSTPRGKSPLSTLKRTERNRDSVRRVRHTHRRERTRVPPSCQS